MTRPWHTLPPLLVDHARRVRVLHLTPAELRGLNRMPPVTENCWQTTPGGRAWQASIEAALWGTDVR